MKKFINRFLLLAVTSVALWSCEKDEVRAVLSDGTAPTLAASSTSLVLNSANATDTAAVFSWDASNFGFQAAVKYILQIDKAGRDFAEPKEYIINGLEKKFTTAEFNTMALLLGLPPANESELEVRIKADIGSGVEPVLSNVVKVKATPYLVIINYPSLYLPGAYQGWNPAEAPKVSSKTDNGVYEGYVYFGSASAFKFTSDPDWNHTNYGDGGAGKLSTSGGDLNIAAPGYYLMKANTKDLTWSATKTIWGVVGSATGSWDVDKDMTYDEASKTWKATLDLVQGEIKFRANDGWDINLGDDNADKNMEYGGSNIAIASAGNYDIIMDLSIPGNYTYTVKKN